MSQSSDSNCSRKISDSIILSVDADVQNKRPGNADRYNPEATFRNIINRTIKQHRSNAA